MTAHLRYDHAEIRRLIDAGHTNTAIGRTLRMDPAIVGYIRQRPRLNASRIDADDVLHLHRRGLTGQQIADRLDCHRRTICRILRRARVAS